jgi:hypothetical protein
MPFANLLSWQSTPKQCRDVLDPGAREKRLAEVEYVAVDVFPIGRVFEHDLVRSLAAQRIEKSASKMTPTR